MVSAKFGFDILAESHDLFQYQIVRQILNIGPVESRVEIVRTVGMPVAISCLVGMAVAVSCLERRDEEIHLMTRVVEIRV